MQPYPLQSRPLTAHLDSDGCCFVGAMTPNGDAWEWLYGEPVLDHGTHWLPYYVRTLPARAEKQ